MHHKQPIASSVFVFVRPVHNVTGMPREQLEYDNSLLKEEIDALREENGTLREEKGILAEKVGRRPWTTRIVHESENIVF